MKKTFQIFYKVLANFPTFLLGTWFCVLFGILFLIDEPTNEIYTGLKNYQLGLIMIIFSPYFGFHTIKESN